MTTPFFDSTFRTILPVSDSEYFETVHVEFDTQEGFLDEVFMQNLRFDASAPCWWRA